MQAAEQPETAQAQLCNAFFALAGAPESAGAIAEADQALWALDALLDDALPEDAVSEGEAGAGAG